jgi:hypothetical protein
MKIYNKIVWDKDGNVIEEDSYDYNGPITHLGGRPKPPPPPPYIPPPPPPPPPAPEPEPIVPDVTNPSTPEGKKQTATEQRKRRSGRTGQRQTGTLGVAELYTGIRRNLLG